ncbi:MAG: phosphatidylglycerophosphatase A [Pseudomonadota bacterium]
MNPDARFLFAHPAHFIALGFGTGLSPWAPGTFGTLAALPLYWLLLQAGLQLPVLLAAIAAGFALGIWACAVAGKNLGAADHGGIVWDEIVAMWLVLAFAPATWLWWLAAFGFFRFFDILKPWPIRFFDTRLKNGFGVMFDDLLAALYALLIIKGWQWLA